VILPILLQGAITVVRLPEPSAANVTCQALVRLPKLSDVERICIKVAWPTILEGSDEYSSFALRRYLQQAGKPIVAHVMSDHLLLRVTFPKNQFNTAASMLESLIRRPLLNAEDLEKALVTVRTPRKDAWAAAIEPESWREVKPSRDEILSVYRKIVRPENLVLAFGGDFQPEQVQAALSRFSDWAPKPETSYVRPWAATFSPLMKSPTSVATVELTGPEISASDPSLPVRLLETATLAMGSGSALYKVAREQHGWSYVQEGFLYPTQGGVRLRILLEHGGTEEVLSLIDPLRSDLENEVKAWTQADRARGLTLLKSWLLDGLGFSPIWLLPEGKVVQSEDEKTHLAAWWRMKFGLDLNAEQLAASLEKVKLDELRAATLADLESASARMLIPSK
jgi:hypothetical protein